MKGHPVLTVCLYKTIAARTDFKKGTFKPLDCRQFKKEISPGLGPPSQVHSFKFKESGWKKNKTTNKQKHMNTHTHAWTTMNIHGRPWALERAWAPMNSHELVFFQIQCSWQITCWTICFTVFEFLFWVVGYASFWFDCFVSWTEHYFYFSVLYLFVLSCGGFAPQKNPCQFLQNMIFWLIYMSIIYVYSHLFIYSNIYIYMCVCNVMYLYIQYKYIYIYVCLCVCVGGGLPQNEVSFFPLKEPFLEPKKDRHIHVYTICIYIYTFLTGVFLNPVLVCPIQNIFFLVFFRM